MNRIYDFYFENDVFNCIIVNRSEVKHFVGAEAIKMLKKVDSFNYSRFSTNKGTIRFKSSNSTVILRNIDVLLEKNYFKYLKRNFDKLKLPILKITLSSDIKERIVEYSKSKSKIATGFAAMLCIIAAANNVSTNIVDKIDYSIESFDDDINPAIISESEDEKFSILGNDLDIAPHAIHVGVDIIDDIIEEDTQEVIMEDNEEFIEETIDPTIAYLDFNDATDSEKYQYVVENFSEIVDKYSNKWGLDSNLVLATLTQESGGKYKNLMQIQFSSWEDMPLTVYNYEKNRYDTIVLTNDSSKYKDKNITCISKKRLSNPKTNISVGCIILRYSLEKLNNHVGAAVQCYNFGYTNTMNVLKHTAKKKNIKVSDILDDQSNLDFVDYTDIIDAGDRNYLKHVFQYLSNDSDSVNIKYIDENGLINNLAVSFLPEKNRKR